MSELKSILVHLDASPESARRLHMAYGLAQAHGAQLQVMYAVMPTVLLYPYAFTADAAAAPLLLSYENEQRERARALFERERAAVGGMPGVAWSEATGEPVLDFTHRAWGSDLLVLGQYEPGEKAMSGVPADFAASVLVETGKPGLLMPYIDTGPALGRTVLVAWKATRESARAVTAALPLLQRAARVHVAAWEEAQHDGAAHAPLDIEPFLQRHGIAATVHRGGRPTADLGDLLLSLASDLQADLLVMGCYGHGRAREWVLGGVTRTCSPRRRCPCC
jgi:nucleotide-binding universal stress UspA family protein